MTGKSLKKASDAPILVGTHRPLHPFWWFCAVVGMPILAVTVHLWAEQRYPTAAIEVALLTFGTFSLLYLGMMWFLRLAIRDKIADLISDEEGSDAAGKVRTASAIAAAVVVGFSLITALLVFDFYGQYKASLYASGKSELDSVVMEAGSVPATQPRDVSKSGQESNVRSEPNLLERSGVFFGPFGDFFGGVINPVLTFGTLVALAITMMMQRTQLDVAERSARESSELLAKQTFETTFFNMLSLHNTTVQDLKFVPSSIEIPIWYDDPELIDGGAVDESDDEYLDFLNGQEPDAISGPVKLSEAKGREVFARVLELMNSDDHESTPMAVYHRIQKHHNYVLGHYFRTLYQIFELIDEYSITDGHDAAKRYSSIMRAQLSANELILLFYNCSYTLVDNGEFRRLLNTYEVLEHMPLDFKGYAGVLTTPGYAFDIGMHVRQYLEIDDPQSYDGGAFGRNPVAKLYFESKMPR